KRRLYTDNEIVTFSVNAFIGLTSRTADFMRDDIADRTLPIRVKRLDRMLSESELVRRVVGSRDAIWTEIILDLQRILQWFQEHGLPTHSGSFRQADWAALMKPI